MAEYNRRNFLAVASSAVVLPTALRPPLASKNKVSPKTGTADLPWFNVVDYGADPTGAVDSSTAFNNAIAAANAAPGGFGGLVIAPGGTYLISANVNPLNNVTIEGYGATLIANAGAGRQVFSSSTTLQNVTIVGFNFQMKPNGASAIAFLAFSNTDITFRDLYFNAAGESSGQLVIVGKVDDTSLVNNHSARIHVDHCTFYNGNTGSYEALLLASCDESSVTNCKFNAMSTSAAPLAIYAYCNGVVVSGNSFRASSGCLYVQQGQNITIIGNLCRNGGNLQDVVLKNCQNVKISQNSFVGQSTSTAIAAFDYSAAYFDGVHPTQFLNSAALVTSENLFSKYATGVLIPSKTGTGFNVAPTNVVITNNLFVGVMTPTNIGLTVPSPVVKNNP